MIQTILYHQKKLFMDLSLRHSKQSDLEVFFLNQIDEEANYMAAFTPKNPHDKEAYMAKWNKLLKDDTINMQTILIDDAVYRNICLLALDRFADYQS